MAVEAGSDADKARNLATIWETIADEVPDSPALIHGDLTRTWREFEDRAARLASALSAAGLGADSKVAHFLFNGPEYLETSFGAMKIRGVPVNVNYRYLEDELAYLLDNSDAEAIVFSDELADRVAAVMPRSPGVKLWLQVDSSSAGDAAPVPTIDGAVSYEEAIGASKPQAPQERSANDLWFLYTGGTTGMPKGVMWPHDSLVGTTGATLRPLGLEEPQSIDQARANVRDLHGRGEVRRLLPAAPLMHGTSGLTSLISLSIGGAVVTVAGSGLDADALLTAVQQNRVNTMTIVGDVFAKPMIAAMRRAIDEGRPYDTSSLTLMVSSGVMWSAETKAEILELIPDVMLLDSLGSSEGVGFGGSVSAAKKKTATAKFTLGENTRVFTDDGQEVQAGSGDVGVLAVGGLIPLGYYKDETKSAETFREINGRRWSMPGDFATVEADGTITLLGRGSVSINSGGEKIFPEEVEEALKTHDSVHDANVVGLADEKWGQRVVAVASPCDGHAIDAEALIAHVKTVISPFKAPKEIVAVDAVMRGPNGKADYRWAKSVAEDASVTT